MDKYIAIIVILLGVQTSIIVSEPICSKYDYDEKTLQKLIRLEWKFERLMDDMESFKSEWKNVKSDVNTKMESMSTLLNGVNEKITTEFEEWKNRKTDVDTKFENMLRLLNGVNERMTNESEEWKNRNTDVDTKLKDMSTLLNGVNESTVAEFEKSKSEMEQLTTRLTKDLPREPVESSRAIIAFSATNLKDSTPVDGQILIFQDIDFNVGGGYDANTGIFTAPESGLYLFTTHVCNNRGHYAIYAVINDGTAVLRSVQVDNDSYSCHSIPVVTHVRSGGEVKVQNMYSASSFYQESNRRLVFSGVILNQD